MYLSHKKGIHTIVTESVYAGFLFYRFIKRLYIGRRRTLVIFNLAIIAKLKCDDLCNINDKIITLCYASANFIFAQKQEKPDKIGLFRLC